METNTSRVHRQQSPANRYRGTWLLYQETAHRCHHTHSIQQSTFCHFDVLFRDVIVLESSAVQHTHKRPCWRSFQCTLELQGHIPCPEALACGCHSLTAIKNLTFQSTDVQRHLQVPKAFVNALPLILEL